MELPQIPRRRTSEVPAAPPTPGVRRILIVEDNPDSREMLRMLLELAGHEVHEAQDGPDGLAALERVRPDVALIDLGLPGFDGYELARRARQADDRPAWWRSQGTACPTTVSARARPASTLTW